MKNIFLFLLMYFVFIGNSLAFEIYNLSIDNLNGNINLDFQINLNEQDILNKYVDLGDSIFIDIKVEVVKSKILFFDSKISEKKVNIVIKKDMIKNEYVLIKDGIKRNYSNFTTLVNSIKVFKLSLGPWYKIDKGFTYKVIVETEITARKIPNWLKKILFFWNFNLSGPYYYEMEINY
ncbi:MAG: hypothetical protein PWR24_70 [Desulfonauticus sp.]|nr:hypothetical protein [Desulfonauticus sp.]